MIRIFVVLLSLLFCTSITVNVPILDRRLESFQLPEFSVEFNGRLGNLMFEYAAILGICSKILQKTEFNSFENVASCARITNPTFYELENPISELVSLFNLSLSVSSKPFQQKGVYQEHAEDPHMIIFDEKVFNQASGVKFKGYFQSWRYFHPHAESIVKRAYSYPIGVETAAQAFISAIRSECKSENCKLVGVQVRIGDKLNNNFYDQWSLREHYFKKAMSLIIKEHSRTTELHFVFFVGGGMSKSDMIRDSEWARTHLFGDLSLPSSSNHHNINNHNNKSNVFYHIEETGEHQKAMRALSLCDALIIGQSSFGWWAAYLSNSSTVIAPRGMFNEKGPHFQFDDYFMTSWTLLSSNKSLNRIVGFDFGD